MNELTALERIYMVICLASTIAICVLWLRGLFMLVGSRKPTRFLVLLLIPPIGLLIEARNSYNEWLKQKEMTAKEHRKRTWLAVMEFWRSLDWNLW